MPLADGLLREERSGAPRSPGIPLTVALCADCGLVQIRENVAPDELFCRDYPYFSSFIPALLRHSQGERARS